MSKSWYFVLLVAIVLSFYVGLTMKDVNATPKDDESDRSAHWVLNYFTLRLPVQNQVKRVRVWVPDKSGHYGQFVPLVKLNNGFWVCQIRYWTGRPAGELWIQQELGDSPGWSRLDVRLDQPLISVKDMSAENSDLQPVPAGSPIGLIYFSYKTDSKNVAKITFRHGWQFGGTTEGELTLIEDGQWVGVGRVNAGYSTSTLLPATIIEHTLDNEGEERKVEIEIDSVDIIGHIPAAER